MTRFRLFSSGSHREQRTWCDMRVLIVEDEPKMAGLVRRGLVEGVRAARDIHAATRPGALAPAAARARLAFRVREPLERRRRLRPLPARKARSTLRPHVLRDGPRCRLSAARSVKRLPIRIRLAVVFSAAMAAVLLGAGWFAYARVGADLSQALDLQLRGRAQDLSALVLRGGSLRTTSGRLVEHGEAFAQLLTRRGRIVDATPPLRRAVLLRPGELARVRSHDLFVNRP